SDMPGEKEHVIKLPEFFRDTFAANPQLTEDVGEAMAKWAAGTTTIGKRSAADLIAAYAACSEPSEFRRLEAARKVSWPSISKDDKPSVKAASEQCAKKIEDAARVPDSATQATDDNDEFTETAAAS